MHRQVVRSISAAADGDDDFERIAIGEHLIRMAAARHDFAVALDRDPLAGKLEALEQLAAVERFIEAVRFAVDG
jgi:hypothetical protein